MVSTSSTTRDEGSTTRDEGSTTRDEGSTTRHEGSTTRHEGSTTRDEGSTTRHEGSTTRDDGSTTRDDGSTTRDRDSGVGRGRRSRPSVPELVERAREGDARSVARLISLVEDASPLLREVMTGLAPYTGHAQIVGITGAPGVGKSTSTSALVTGLRAVDKRVGVLAVDPSSPFSGGALLGDRVRMQDHALDRQVYIRSMASRGHLGGLAWSTPQALRVLDAAGCDVVVIETVGVGQSEVDIAGLADTTLVLVAPGMGDGIQAAKAGILEIGDVYVVNKADRDGADQVRRDLRNMIALADRGEDSWRPPIVKTVAQTGEGVDEVVERIHAHRAWLETSGELRRRRVRRARDEIEAIAVTALRARWGDVHARTELDALAEQVADGGSDPYTAADTLLETYTETRTGTGTGTG